MASKSSRKYYRNLADKLWQELMWFKWGGCCGLCGRALSREEAIGHHFIGRRVYHLRHHPENGILTDNECHSHKPYAPHRSPESFMEMIASKYPESYEWIQEHQYESGQKPDYKEVCEFLREEIRKWQ